MDRAQFIESLDGLPSEQQTVLFNNFPAVRELATRLTAAVGSIFFTRTLKRGPGTIARLVKQGGPWRFENSDINDANYPVKGEGIVAVRYRVLKGHDLKCADGYVYRADVEARFRTERMRCPNAAEALLVPAEDKEIGRGEHPLVAFISGSGDAFFVDELESERSLGRSSDFSRWFPGFWFLGVCE